MFLWKEKINGLLQQHQISQKTVYKNTFDASFVLHQIHQDVYTD
jgi:hypothetical protein